jgi:hypothetical protein
VARMSPAPETDVVLEALIGLRGNDAAEQAAPRTAPPAPIPSAICP